MNYSFTTTVSRNTAITTARIEAQEEKDRFVASKCLEEIFKKGRDLQITPTEITSHVDLKCSIINQKNKKIPFNVEIKERYKNQEQLEKYPNAELKVSKYKGMKQETPKGTLLLYMVLLNNKTCLVFDLDNLDWSKVEMRKWRTKRTQMSDNSDYIEVPTFFIPYELASVSIDCSQYFNEWTTTVS